MTVANQVLAECDSTNRVARALGAEGAAHGTWVSARVQTQGRGRLDRKWESPAGNLFLSIIIRNVPMELWSWIPLTTAVGIYRCLTELFPEISIQIKWPNDLWVKGAKVGGILCEGGGGFVVIGIGLNCLSTPPGLDRLATNLTEARGGIEVGADQIRLGVKDFVLAAVEELREKGPGSICRDYERVAVLMKGTPVEWGEEGSGRVDGLGSHGELVVKLSSGELKAFFADEIRIAMIK